MVALCRFSVAALLVLGNALAQSTPNFRYFYDDSAQMFRVLDSTGTLVEYIYDPNGNITQINRSTVAPNAVSILSFAPFSGIPGQTITIYGQNFSASAAGDIVKINGVTATIVSASSTVLVVKVPTGATSGQISVTVNGTTISSGTLNFTVEGPPVITSITPNFGSVGQVLQGVVVQGANLDAAEFDLQGGGLVIPVSVTSTQATLNLTLGSTPGRYVMIATGFYGASTNQLGNGNFFDVYTAPGTNYAELLTSVLNTSGPTPGIPAGSNEVDRLFSTQNSGKLAGSIVLSLSLGPLRGGGKLPPNAQGNATLAAGQTIRVDVNPPVLMRRLELDVNGATMASSSTGALRTLFTAPSGIASLDLQAAGFAADGTVPGSLPQSVQLAPDPGRKIAGRVTGVDGAPLAEANMSWQAQGLAAEYFRFDREIDGIPDLAGLKPDRTGYVSAINLPNPLGVFGNDPMGAGLGPNYAARFHGTLQANTYGEYTFQLLAHANARLRIDGKKVSEALSASGVAEVQGRVHLEAGAHEIEVLYYQFSGDPALQLQWITPEGNAEIVPPSALEIQSMFATGKDGGFAFTIPAAIDGVRVNMASPKGKIVLEQENVIQ